MRASPPSHLPSLSLSSSNNPTLDKMRDPVISLSFPPSLSTKPTLEEIRVWAQSFNLSLSLFFPPSLSTKPTLEEIRVWAQSFDKLMKNPAGRNVFREFLRTEYSEENMLFWLACEDLKQEMNKNTVEEKARMIYEDYISILSPKEVSLDSRVREVINRKIQEPTPHTFDDAQLQIYTLMHRDSYPRFLNSSLYRSLLHPGSRTSSEL
uniref:Regulator of G-protein signaling 20 n=1 Tax=Hucho hucho TaxID=62062 RepID=A0A4W5KSR7_9TELE